MPLMFTPEFVVPEEGKVVLVASHFVATDVALRLSVDFVRARIENGRKHLPAELQQFEVHFDLRGQALPEGTLKSIDAALGDVCTVVVRTS